MTYHSTLYKKIDEFLHDVYRVTRTFPKYEIYGVTSQLRRAALSIMLNYVEGYARQKKKVNINFLEISYSSIQEVKYLLRFSKDENYMPEKEYNRLYKILDEIAAMIWVTLENKRS